MRTGVLTALEAEAVEEVAGAARPAHKRPAAGRGMHGPLQENVMASLPPDLTDLQQRLAALRGAL